MKTTLTLSGKLNCSIFEIFNQDCDEVITLINFILLLGEETKTAETTTTPLKTNTNNKRIKVNDKTASGGWF